MSVTSRFTQRRSNPCDWRRPARVIRSPTGPNLHYEVLRDGNPVNPRTLDLPPQRRLKGRSLAAFQAQVRRLELAMERSANVERVAHFSDNE